MAHWTHQPTIAGMKAGARARKPGINNRKRSDPKVYEILGRFLPRLVLRFRNVGTDGNTFMVNVPNFGVTSIDLAITVAGRRDDALSPI